MTEVRGALTGEAKVMIDSCSRAPHSAVALLAVSADRPARRDEPIAARSIAIPAISMMTVPDPMATT